MADGGFTGAKIGDAVFQFLGDTTQFDRAFEKVTASSVALEGEAASLSAAWGLAGNSIAQAGNEVRNTGAAAVEAAPEFMIFGQTGKEAADEVALNMREAKAEIALLGEEAGVRVPRHLRTFVAELPGVGAALNAAFAATAVLMLMQILVEASTKLSEFISNKFIYTEQMKAEEKATIALNHGLVEQLKTLGELQKAYRYIGLEGSRKVKEEFTDLTTEVHKNEAALRNAENVVYMYAKGLNNISREAAMAAENQKTLLTAIIASQQQQQANLSKQYDLEALHEHIQFGEAIIAGDRKVGEERIKLALTQGAILLALGKTQYGQYARLKGDSDEKQYQLERDTLVRRRALLREDAVGNKVQIATVDKEIEALALAHREKLLSGYAEMLSKLKLLRTSILSEVKTSTIAATTVDVSPTTDAINKLAAAFDQFGLRTTASITAERIALQDLEQQTKQYARVGIATKSDLLAVQIRLAQAEIEEDGRYGRSTKDKIANMRKLVDEYNKLTSAAKKQLDIDKRWHDFWRASAPEMKKNFMSVGQIGKAAFFDLTEAMGSAIMAAELGADSLGAALRKATAQVLAQISAQSAVYALFELAKGFASLAEQDYVSADLHFHAAAQYAVVAGVAGVAAALINPGSSNKDKQQQAGGGVTPEGPSSQAQSNPVQTQNVHRFAGGALVTRPTLAVIGDSKGGGRQKEGVIPLEDPDAMRTIGDAVAGAMPQRAGDTHVHMPNLRGIVSADVIDGVIDHINARVDRGKVLVSSKSRRVEKKA